MPPGSQFTHRPVNKLGNTVAIQADHSNRHVVRLKRLLIRSCSPDDVRGNLLPPDLLIFRAAVKLKCDGVRACVPMGQLEPGIGYHGNVAVLLAGNAWHAGHEERFASAPARRACAGR